MSTECRGVRDVQPKELLLSCFCWAMPKHGCGAISGYKTPAFMVRAVSNIALKDDNSLYIVESLAASSPIVTKATATRRRLLLVFLQCTFLVVRKACIELIDPVRVSPPPRSAKIQLRNYWIPLAIIYVFSAKANVNRYDRSK